MCCCGEGEVYLVSLKNPCRTSRPHHPPDPDGLYEKYAAQTDEQRQRIDELEGKLKTCDDAEELFQAIELAKSPEYESGVDKDVIRAAEDRVNDLRMDELRDLFARCEEAVKKGQTVDPDTRWNLAEELYRATVARTDLSLLQQDKAQKLRQSLLTGVNLPAERIMLDEQVRRAGRTCWMHRNIQRSDPSNGCWTAVT